MVATGFIVISSASLRLPRHKPLASRPPMSARCRAGVVSQLPGGSAGGAGATTLAPVRETNTVVKKRDPGGKYKVLIFNDSFNTMEGVQAALLKAVPGLSSSEAWAIMKKSHEDGSAVVGVWVFELAEAYCDALRSLGIGSDIEEE